jgi:iron complex transport system substrate-binding protein
MTTRNEISFLFIVSFMALYLVACQQPTSKNGAGTGGRENEAPGNKDSLSAKSVIKYAHGFRIDYYDHYKEVKILNRSGDRMDTLDYLLVREGNPVPPGHPGAQVISIPVRSLVVMSSMHIAQADFAGVADRITGLGNGQYVNSTIVRDGMKMGKVKEVGIDANINNELVITMRPGVLMAMSNPDAAF